MSTILSDAEKQVNILTDIIEPEKKTQISRRKSTSTSNTLKNNKSVEEAIRDEIRVDNKSVSQQIQDSQKPSEVVLEDALRRQKKVKEIKSKIAETDQAIVDIKRMIGSHTKNFDYQIDISNMPVVKKAVRKIFKKSLKYINKEMYLYAVDKMLELQEQRLDEEIAVNG